METKTFNKVQEQENIYVLPLQAGEKFLPGLKTYEEYIDGYEAQFYQESYSMDVDGEFLTLVEYPIKGTIRISKSINGIHATINGKQINRGMCSKIERAYILHAASLMSL